MDGPAGPSGTPNIPAYVPHPAAPMSRAPTPAGLAALGGSRAPGASRAKPPRPSPVQPADAALDARVYRALMPSLLAMTVGISMSGPKGRCGGRLIVRCGHARPASPATLHRHLQALCYLTRTNLAYAARQLTARLGLSENAFGAGAALFYVGYVAAQVPAAAGLVRFGPKMWLSALTAAWGVVGLGFACVRTRGQARRSKVEGLVGRGEGGARARPRSARLSTPSLIITQLFGLRIALGAAQAGTFPGAWWLLSRFFAEADLGLAYAMATSGAVAAQARRGKWCSLRGGAAPRRPATPPHRATAPAPTRPPRHPAFASRPGCGCPLGRLPSVPGRHRRGGGVAGAVRG